MRHNVLHGGSGVPGRRGLLSLPAAPRLLWTIWGVSSLVGGGLVALPDAGSRVFSISRLHGPSPVDVVGAVVLTAGWVLLDVVVLRDAALLRARVGGRALVGGVAVLATGAAVLAVTIFGDLGAWWVLGAALLALPQLAAAIVVTRAGRPRGGGAVSAPRGVRT